MQTGCQHRAARGATGPLEGRPARGVPSPGIPQAGTDTNVTVIITNVVRSACQQHVPPHSHAARLLKPNKS